jgi:hypothetical protein
LHETGIIDDLLAMAENLSSGNPDLIASLTLRIGALSGISEASLGRTAHRLMAERWGREPGLVIEVSDDVSDQGALGVTLVGIRIVG